MGGSRGDKTTGGSLARLRFPLFLPRSTSGNRDIICERIPLTQFYKCLILRKWPKRERTAQRAEHSNLHPPQVTEVATYVGANGCPLPPWLRADETVVQIANRRKRKLRAVTSAQITLAVTKA